MLDPIQILQSLWDALSDPAGRWAALAGFAMYLAFFAPVGVSVWALRSYAKSHGRSLAKGNRPNGNSREPFSDPRLNEALVAIRRRSIPVGFAVVAAGIVASFVTHTNALMWVASGIAYFIFFSRHIFVEACIAFGAELAPTEEPSVARVSGTA